MSDDFFSMPLPDNSPEYYGGDGKRPDPAALTPQQAGAAYDQMRAAMMANKGSNPVFMASHGHKAPLSALMTALAERMHIPQPGAPNGEGAAQAGAEHLSALTAYQPPPAEIENTAQRISFPMAIDGTELSNEDVGEARSHFAAAVTALGRANALEESSASRLGFVISGALRQPQTAEQGQAALVAELGSDGAAKALSDAKKAIAVASAAGVPVADLLAVGGLGNSALFIKELAAIGRRIRG